MNQDQAATATRDNLRPKGGDQSRADYIWVKNFSFNYTPEARVLKDISMEIPEKKVTAFIGPSGCGKSTLLRNFNRMNDLIPGISHEGTIHVKDQEIFDPKLEVIALRKRVRMIFQKPNPFSKSIYENVAYSLRIAGKNDKKLLDEVVESSLRGAALWDEVKDRLHESALGLSGGQTQRLCIAHAIANQPEVLLMDEPCSALDPVATTKIENLISQLKEKFTVVIVTHNMAQATRISDLTAYFYLGELVEMGATEQVFQNPQRVETERYISGKFG